MALDLFKSWSIFLIFAILLGCSEKMDQTKVSPVSSKEKAQFLAESPDQDISSKWAKMVSNIKDISVITRDGSEIDIDSKEFADSFGRCPLVQETQSGSHALSAYTVLIRSHAEQPAVLQVSAEGIKWENRFYANEEAVGLAQYIHRAVASRFFRQLKVDRIMLTSIDLDRIKRIPDEKLESFLDMLRTAEFLPGKPRLVYPLFPYYVLELDVGGKEIIEVDILSPTLISLKQSSNSVYYQTKDSILPLLKEEIASIDYSEQSPKYLFKAEQVRIIGQNRPLVINNQHMNGLETQSFIHSLVRTLAKGERVENLSKKKASPTLKVEFIIGKETVPVYIYQNSFEYKGNTFELEGILDQYLSMVESGVFVN